MTSEQSCAIISNARCRWTDHTVICGGRVPANARYCWAGHLVIFGACSGLRSTTRRIKARGTDLEKRLLEALSGENWGASSSLLNHIAQDTYD